MMHASARQRLREARLAAGLSLRELARRLNVSASLLSQIENGKSDPSVSSLYALVSELGLSLDALLEPAGAEQRAGAREGQGARPVDARSPVLDPASRRVLEMDSGVRWEQLTPGADPRVDALLTTYEPGGSSSSSGRLMTHGGVEYAYLFEGELVLELGFESYVIRAGDSLVFESSTPHLYRNVGDVPARGVWYVVGRAAATPPAPVGPTGTQFGLSRLTSAAEALEAFEHH